MMLPRPFPGQVTGGPLVQPITNPSTKGTPTGPQYGPQVGPVDPMFNVDPSVGPVAPSAMPNGPTGGAPVPMPMPAQLKDATPYIGGDTGPTPRERLAAALIGQQQPVEHPMQAIGNAASMMAQAYADKRAKERFKAPINPHGVMPKGPPKFNPPPSGGAYAPPRKPQIWPKG